MSRKSAKKGRALLEKLGLTPERIDACYSSHPLDEVEAVQAGLYAWKDDVTSDPTWKVLVEAMVYAGIGAQHVEELKEELFQNENGEWSRVNRPNLGHSEQNPKPLGSERTHRIASHVKLSLSPCSLRRWYW